MTDTPRHGITKLPSSQANAEILVNEGFTKPEQGSAIFSVESDTLTAPPGGESDGAVYIIGGSPTGGWASFANRDLAVALGSGAASGWRKITPWDGCLAWDKADNHWLLFDGSSWTVGSAITDLSLTGTYGSDWSMIQSKLNDIISALEAFGAIT